MKGIKRYIDNFKDAIVFEEVVSCLVDHNNSFNKDVLGDDMVKEYIEIISSISDGEFHSRIITCYLKYIVNSFKNISELISIKFRSDEEEHILYSYFIYIARYAMNLYTGYMFRSLDCQKTADRMVSIYRKKNADYGNSFDRSLDEDGLLVAKIRIGDKVHRLLSLTGENAKEAQVKDESIADTLLDLANYCLMTIVWINNNGYEKRNTF